MSRPDFESGITRLVSGLGVLTELMAVSGLWLLCCLPVVTIGAATAAAYYTAVKAVRRHRGGIWQSFRTALCENLRQGIASSLVLAAVLAMVVFYVLALGSVSGGLYSLLLGLVVLLAALLLAVVVWFFPVLSRFRQGIGLHLSMAFAMALRHPLQTVVLMAALVISTALCLLAPPMLLLFPGVLAWGGSFLLEPVLREATDVQNTAEDDPWYLE